MTYTPEEFGLEDIERPCGGLIVGRKGHITAVLLDRPERRNAFTREIMSELHHLWTRLDTDGRTRCIVFGTTSSDFFCSGIDVKEVATSGEGGADKPWGRGPHLTTKHAHVFTPVVCAVEGAVVGGGMHFVLDADIVVAGEGATFFDTHASLGMVGATETVGMTVRAGIGSALYFSLGGPKARIDANQALSLGLVQRVVPSGQSLTNAFELAEHIASLSPSAVKKTVEVAWSATSLGYEDGLRFGRSVAARQREHPDWREGPRAWAAKRAAEWKD